MATKKSTTPFVGVDALKHADDERKNTPTAKYQSLMADEARKPVQLAYPRGTSNADPLKAVKAACNHDLDPQFVWRGKIDPARTVVHGYDPSWTNRAILDAMRHVDIPSRRPA